MNNWGGEENAVMRGYIHYAIDEWNKNYSDDPLSPNDIHKLMVGLRWAIDDMTAEEAYNYYMKK